MSAELSGLREAAVASLAPAHTHTRESNRAAQMKPQLTLESGGKRTGRRGVIASPDDDDDGLHNTESCQ